MKFLVKSAWIIAVLASPAGCAVDLSAVQELMSEPEIKIILTEEAIERISSVEQQPQDNGTVSLLVASNRRDTAFAGCVEDRTDMEIVRSEQGWKVRSRSDFPQVALVPCNEEGVNFAPLEGDILSDSFKDSVFYLRQLIKGEISPNLLSGPPVLKSAVKLLDLNEIQSVFEDSEGGFEFQFLSKAISPSLLGIKISFEDGHLNRVFLNDNNAIEVVDP